MLKADRKKEMWFKINKYIYTPCNKDVPKDNHLIHPQNRIKHRLCIWIQKSLITISNVKGIIEHFKIWYKPLYKCYPTLSANSPLCEEAYSFLLSCSFQFKDLLLNVSNKFYHFLFQKYYLDMMIWNILIANAIARYLRIG